MNGQFEYSWPEEKRGQLKELWEQKNIVGGVEYDAHSTAEIARRLGVTKNAVVGQARRMAQKDLLTPRASPIGSGRPPVPPKPERPKSLRLPRLPSIVETSGDEAQVIYPSIVRAAKPPPQEAPQPIIQQVVKPRDRFGSGCQYVIGEPGCGSKWRFCDDDLCSTKHRYCAHHANLCFATAEKAKAA